MFCEAPDSHSSVEVYELWGYKFCCQQTNVYIMWKGWEIKMDKNWTGVNIFAICCWEDTIVLYIYPCVRHCVHPCVHHCVSWCVHSSHLYPWIMLFLILHALLSWYSYGGFIKTSLFDVGLLSVKYVALFLYRIALIIEILLELCLLIEETYYLNFTFDLCSILSISFLATDCLDKL